MVANQTIAAQAVDGRCLSRSGSIQAIELTIALPLLMLVAVAIVEFSLLWSANLRVKEASRAAARVASLPADNLAELRAAASQAATLALNDRRLVEQFDLRLTPGAYTGDPVVVEITVPMKAASPDLLDVVGFSLRERVLRGQTVMRKE